MPEAQSFSPSLPQLGQELPVPTALIERLHRRYLAKAPMLAYADFNQLFILENDTSQVGLWQNRVAKDICLESWLGLAATISLG